MAKITMKIEYDDTHFYDNSTAMIETSDDVEFTSLEYLFEGFAKLIGFSEAVIDRKSQEAEEEYAELDKKYDELMCENIKLKQEISTITSGVIQNII